MALSDRAKTLLLFLVSSSLCLVLVELILRVYFPVNRVVYALDADCLYKPTPGSSKVFRHLKVNGGESIVVKFNSLGLRGEELVPRSRGLFRIVVYGDSFIEGEFSKVEDSFVKRLERALNARPGRPVEVANAGVVGYGPDQISVRLEKDLSRLDPDLVAVAVYAGNDFGDLLRDKIYRLGPHGELVRNHPTLHWSLRAHMARVGEGRPLDEGMLARNLRKLEWEVTRRFVEMHDRPRQGDGEDLVEWSLRSCRFDYEDYVLRRNDTVVNLFEDWFDADVSLQPDSESARYKIRLMEQVLRRIKATADAHGVPLLLLIVPDAIDVSPSHHFRVKAGTFAGHDPARPTRILADIASRNGIDAVDLFPAFRASKPERLFFRDPETHWNDAGQELATRSVAEAILSRGLIDAGLTSSSSMAEPGRARRPRPRRGPLPPAPSVSAGRRAPARSRRPCGRPSCGERPRPC